ncbi:hypothetical protein EXU57_15380 [Segetibacter sp. 3557_3]|uniref:hypothetical protein n=1 Tax=Segetibacter sp. 3557_3 TaxID=2547429 RepID=UPI0010585B2E|nr:hypothetical protein [Segetibacter sp. 3557_3]TDH24195.1 hypothetical protein EXU57_15380 [Segetibacter sp. 3557_3]
MRKATIIVILTILVFPAMVQVGIAQQNIVVTTSVNPPIDLFINQALSNAGRGIFVTLTNPANNPPAQVRLLGSLRRIFPLPEITIRLNEKYRPAAPITLPPGQPFIVNNRVLSEAFGNFREADVVVSGISFNDLRDGINYKVPEGRYQLCIEVRNFANDEIRSVQPTNCPTFEVCYKASAPQFTQPINSLALNTNITVIKPLPTTIFTWTPPMASCALANRTFTYEFEVREILDNQTITDALNNPYIFRKAQLPSTTFLFDANLYRDVLKPGRRYITRVRALNLNRTSPVLIDNEGFSRVEAFQYGETNENTNPITLNEPGSFYIPFTERKSEYWDNIANEYASGGKKDTLIPVKEYIGFRLMQQGIAYSIDAIDLFLALNPELARVKFVSLSHKPKLPQLPVVSPAKAEGFNRAYATDLTPDSKEAERLLQLSDSLNSSAYVNRYPDNLAGRIKELNQALANLKGEAGSINRVSAGLINSLLSELLYVLRSGSNPGNVQVSGHLQEVLTDLNELVVSAKFAFNRFPQKLSSERFAGKRQNAPAHMKVSFASYTGGEGYEQPYLPAPADALLPLNVVVFRKGTAPVEPLLSAPDLNATYRIFYTVRGLYNYKNPEINAKTVSQLASTTQVSLPLTSIYKFWSMNMLDHKLTKPADIDIKDLFIKSKRSTGTNKPLTILIKVD